jgi:hypothetical protein
MSRLFRSLLAGSGGWLRPFAVPMTLAVGVFGWHAPVGAAPSPIALASSAKEANKAPDFSAEILVLHASNSKKGIDARIGSMPELSKPPFSSYDTYELLNRAKLPLSKQSPKTLELPNGRILETKLIEVLDADVVRLSATISQPGGKQFLPLLGVKAKVGQAFIVAGQSHKKGILVLVIRVVR